MYGLRLCCASASAAAAVAVQLLRSRVQQQHRSFPPLPSKRPWARAAARAALSRGGHVHQNHVVDSSGCLAHQASRAPHALALVVVLGAGAGSHDSSWLRVCITKRVSADDNSAYSDVTVWAPTVEGLGFGAHQGSRPAHYLALAVVLGSVAGAHELVLILHTCRT